MSNPSIASMSNEDLIAAARELSRRSCAVEAELLLHLGEIDERRLYLDRAFSSMFAFCTRELGFSEGAAYNRILVARAARKLPAIIEAVRHGRVHLAGLRLLAPHLTEENQADLLRRAAGRSKAEIAELVAALAPRPPVPTTIRKLPQRPAAPIPAPALGLVGAASPLKPPPPPPVVPVAENSYKLQVSISRELRDQLREAQDLLRHRVPDGDLATILGTAVELLVGEVKMERFAVGRKARTAAAGALATDSRHVPDAIKRAVYERDGGQCTFLDGRGRRCEEKGSLEFDHREGFARTHRHGVDGLRLLCRAHNQHAAEKMYGRSFMEAARQGSCPGTSDQSLRRNPETPGHLGGPARASQGAAGST
jgi:hypothetical protein